MHHHQPERVPEESMRNIDLDNVGKAEATRRAAPAAAAAAGEDGRDFTAAGAAGAGAAAAAAAAAAAGQHHQRASSGLALLLAQCKRFDVELAAVFLAGILVTTACAIFTKDEGWFRLVAPQRGLVEDAGVTAAVVVFTIGLSTYTAQAHSASDPTLVLYTHQGKLVEASGSAERIALALYAFLVLSLISAAGILWYLALFHGYLKGKEVSNKGRAAAVHCLGLQAVGLGVALLALGTAAFREAVAEAFVRRPHANADGSPINDVDTTGRRLLSEYAYHLTGLTWFLWLLVGGILVFRSCWWAKRGGSGEELEAAELEDGGGAGAHV